MKKRERILVIDDDLAVASTFKTLLIDEGYEVDTAKTGGEASEKIQKKMFNIALIDIHLPDVSGVDLLITMDNVAPKTRKIILTGFPTLSNAVEALNRHADAYLIKPVDVPNMLETIKQQLALQKAETTFNEAKIGKYVQTKSKEYLNHKKSRQPS